MKEKTNAKSRSIEVPGLNSKFDSGFPNSQDIKGNILYLKRGDARAQGGIKLNIES